MPSKFSKRHYESLAEVLRVCRDLKWDSFDHTSKWCEIQGEIMDMLAHDNPRFDREKFNQACQKRRLCVKSA